MEFVKESFDPSRLCHMLSRAHQMIIPVTCKKKERKKKQKDITNIDGIHIHLLKIKYSVTE